MTHKKVSTMDAILVAIAIFLLLYTVAVLYIFVIRGSEPTVLTSCVFVACTGECGFMGWIKTEKIKNSDEKKLQNRSEIP